ncbi:hypothetical protein R83H12_02355 [Fibrobacteria bacterium R8-3-H12]
MANPLALPTVKVNGALVAALWLSSAALVAVMVKVPALVTVSVCPDIAPVPVPPLIFTVPAP